MSFVYWPLGVLRSATGNADEFCVLTAGGCAIGSGNADEFCVLIAGVVRSVQGTRMSFVYWPLGVLRSAQGTRAVHKDAKNIIPDSSARAVHGARRFIHSPRSLRFTIGVAG